MTGEERPWGHFDVLIEDADYKVKRVVVKPGARLSLQLHQFRAEHWYLVAGSAVATIGNDEISLREGQSVDIPREAKHRIECVSDESLVFIEVQRGESVEEDDIIRFEDDYGRTKGV